MRSHWSHPPRIVQEHERVRINREPGGVPSDTNQFGSNVDGFAVQAQDTSGATKETPRLLLINREEAARGVVPRVSVEPGTATLIATGGDVPRVADAVVMVEHTYISGDAVHVARPVAPGSAITFASTEVARGERILRRGALLTARETGTLVVERFYATPCATPGQ
jgi:putative molybdopterin biosynthesis protein